MIAGLRSRHRVTFTVLAVVLPACFAIALASRPSAHRVVAADLMNELTGPSVHFRDAQQWNPLIVTDSVVDGIAFEMIPGWVRVRIPDDVARPDVLLYWSPDPGSIDLAGASLVSEVAGAGSHLFSLLAREYLSRRRAGTELGEFVLYSLGHREILARARVDELAVAPAIPDVIDP